MRPSFSKCAVAVLLSVLSGRFANLAAQTTNATLSGTVTDPSGKVVPGVTITALDTDTGISTTSRTNNEGIYTISALEYGRYRVVVAQGGFKQIELTDLTLEVAASVTRNFQLELGTGSQTVTVEGNALNINTTDGSVSTVINRDFVDQIPLNGRTLQNLLPLSPGISSDQVSSGNVGYSGFTVNGNRDTGSTNWTVDGVSANFGATLNGSSPDTLAGSLTVLGTTQSLISLDALQEFRVSTSSYGVEYGVAPGAQIQLQSRAGTNYIHGSAYDYVRNTIFDSNDWFTRQAGDPKAPEQQNDFGGTLGGPIYIPHLYDGRDKAFFFLSFEDLHLLQPEPLTQQPVPTAAGITAAAAPLQPYLKAFPSPSPNQAGYETEDYGAPDPIPTWSLWNASFSLPSFFKAWSVRGDYALTKSTNLFVHVNYTPSHVGGLDDAYNSVTETDNTMATIGATTLLTSRISNDFRFNYSDSYLADTSNLLSSKFGGTQAAAIALLTPPSQNTAPSGGGFSSDIVFDDFNSESEDPVPGSAVLWLQNEHSKLHQWDLVDSLNWQVGRHLLKFGGEWNRHVPIQAPIGYSETIELDSLYPAQDNEENGDEPSSLQSSNADEFDLTSQPYTTATINTRSSLYAGDTWKVTSRLSVDYGVRWELPFPTYFKGPYSPIYVNSIADIASPSITQGRTEWNMTWRNFAPRLGVAYMLRDRGNFETVLRAGGGLFYSTELGAGVGGVSYPDSNTNYDIDESIPIAPSLLVPPPTGTVTPEGLAENPLVGAQTNLAVPRVWEWNVAIEQGLGANQSLTVNYVASAGRKLFFWPLIQPSSGNIGDVNFTENGSRSDYSSLQLKYDRHLTKGLQTLASYTWAHSLDNVSQDDTENLPLWGNSDFDVRDAFSLALIYDIPGAEHNWVLKAATSGWEISSNFQARTGLPVTGLFYQSLSHPAANGEFTYVVPELVADTPVYLHGDYPGGTKLNFSAFEMPTAGTEGDAGRNQFRDQNFWQDDMSIQRKFALGEKWGVLRFRFDAFNIFNHPNFGGYFLNRMRKSSLFGEAVHMADLLGASSQIYNPGGPRSLQLSLRYEF